MLKKGFLKPDLTITEIGKKQFWIGLAIGLFSAFLINLLLNNSREALRLITFERDALILSPKQYKFYDLFFAAFSSSLGFGFAIISWFYASSRHKLKHYRTMFVATTSFFITFMTLAIVARFGSVLALVLYSLSGYDNHLDILKDFWLLLLLVPLFLFFANWNSVRTLFKTKNWLLVSAILFLFNTVFLYKTTSIDRNRLNQIYYTKNKARIEFIDNEINNAKQMGVEISDSTKYLLQKRYAERTTNLVMQLKETFKTKHKVPLEALILEKIVIHNRNEISYTWNRTIDSTEQNWSYALPEEVYVQILKHDVRSHETRLLFEILSEQISIFTAKDIDWSEYHKYSSLEREQYNFKRSILRKTETIQSRLKQVVALLNSDDTFKDYHFLVPDFESTLNNGQKVYKLEIAGRIEI